MQRLVVEEVGAKETWLDHRGVNAERRELRGERLGKSLDGKFGRAVNAPAYVRLVTADRRKIDEMSRAAGAHVREHSAGYVEQPEDVCLEDTFHLLSAGPFNAAQQTEACTVHEHVDPAVARDRCLDRDEHGMRIGYIETYGEEMV